MKIVFLDASTFGSSFDFAPLKQFGALSLFSHTSIEDLPKRIQDADIVITNKVPISYESLKLAPVLRLICVAATGVNNVDLESARKIGVAVCNVRDYAARSVAQHTLASALYLLHALPYHHHFCSSGGWAKGAIFTHMERPFRELGTMVWGILGMGAIGRETARIVSAFGTRIIYTSLSGQDRAAFERVHLNELLARSDILSIHSPLDDRSRNLIGSSELRLIGSDGILINVGRGGIVDENALLKALEENWIRGAALDVLDEEPPTSRNPLLEFDDPSRLLITPHFSWAGSRQRLLDGLCENIQAFVDGKPIHLV